MGAWTDEALEDLRERYRHDGAKAIAERNDLTLGQVHSRARTEGISRSRKVARRDQLLVERIRKMLEPEPQRPPNTEFRARHGVNEKRLADLLAEPRSEHRTCAYILDDGEPCGDPAVITAGRTSSYCPHHHERCTHPVRPLRLVVAGQVIDTANQRGGK